MRALSVIFLIAICTAYAHAQILYSPSTLSSDSLSTTEISFIPNDFLGFHSDQTFSADFQQSDKLSKALKTTGWLLKDILLRNKFDGTGYYPHSSRLNVDTYTVTQYNSLYRNYPFSY